MTDTLQLGKRITRWRQKFVLHRVNSCVVFKQMFLDKHTLRFFAKKKPTCAGCLQQSQRWPFWRFKSGGLFFCVSYVCVRSTTNVHNYVISCNMSDMTEWFGHACNCDVTVTTLIYTISLVSTLAGDTDVATLSKRLTACTASSVEQMFSVLQASLVTDAWCLYRSDIVHVLQIWCATVRNRILLARLCAPSSPTHCSLF